jgi:methylmalonyl-CoA mutase N-terminal domain/subunit
MTINCTASVALAMYLAIAEKQGVSWSRVGGTMQNDMLKEFIAQKEWICPPEPAVRIVVDMIEFTSKHVPRFNPVSISGYHIREAGSTAVQELAFTLADGLGYVEAACARGLDIDSFAPRLSFFFDIHNDFFEEIAKLRAARRLWARFMKERFGAKKPSRCGSGPTRRRPGCRRPRSSRSTTSRVSRSRLSPPCSAARSRCTRTPTTRRGRCRPRTR